QSESEPHAPQCPFEQRPWPWQSESEPHAPHFPLEQRPYPAQSESEPQLDALAGPRPAVKITKMNAAAALVRSRMGSSLFGLLAAVGAYQGFRRGGLSDGKRRGFWRELFCLFDAPWRARWRWLACGF